MAHAGQWLGAPFSALPTKDERRCGIDGLVGMTTGVDFVMGGVGGKEVGGLSRMGEAGVRVKVGTSD